MLSILIRRLIFLPLVILGVVTFLFIISRLVPSDPVALIAGDAVTPELRQAIISSLGLDQPIHIQYLHYLGDLLTGNLGQSIRYSTPVIELLVDAFPATIVLVGVASVFAVLIAFPLGFLAAAFRGTVIDAAVRIFAMAGIATPAFYLGIVLIMLFGFKLQWFPISGRGDPPSFWHLVLPAFVLGFRDAGSAVRIFRAALLDALGEDYIRAARARGFSERTIVGKFASRNALVPTITDMGLNIAQLTGQVILVEVVFAYPGIGRLLQLGIQWNDFPLVAGAIMVLLCYVVVINLIVDLIHRAVDPRVRAN